MRKISLALVCLLLAAPAFAESAPPEIAPAIAAAKPYGRGAYSWMGITAYEAALWTDAPHWSMQSPFALALTYKMHFTGKEIADRSIREMQNEEPLSKSEAADAQKQFVRLFPEVKSGDRITALYRPGKGAAFFYNGKPTGTLADDKLAQRFLNIWLSEKTSAPDLRKKLLAGSAS